MLGTTLSPPALISPPADRTAGEHGLCFKVKSVLFLVSRLKVYFRSTKQISGSPVDSFCN